MFGQRMPSAAFAITLQEDFVTGLQEQQFALDALFLQFRDDLRQGLEVLRRIARIDAFDDVTSLITAFSSAAGRLSIQ
jgi:hypothetical protein